MLEWFTAEHIVALCLAFLSLLATIHTFVALTPTKKDDELEAKVTGIVKPILDQVVAALQKK